MLKVPMNLDGYLEPVGTSWRSSALPSVARPILDKEGAKTHIKSNAELTVHSLQPVQSYCTWAATHNYLDVVAFHSCTRNRNVFRVVSLKLNQEDPVKSSMEAVSQIKLERPGSLASMADNLIAIAMEDGTIQLYNLKDTATRKYIEEPKKISTLSIPAKVAGAATSTAMSTTLSSTGIEKRNLPPVRQALALDLTSSGSSPGGASSSVSPQRLLAQIQENIHVWEINRPEAPIQSIKTTVVSTRAVRWCPLSPSHQHLSRGSTNGTLKVYDLRSRDPGNAIWTAKRAHQSAIRDLAWNPFIPYWVATAGADSMIQVWDTRYGAKPVRQLTDHSNAVNVLAWSPTNVEMLASGGADRRFKLWNLRTEPHYVISTLGVWDSSVVGVGWTQTRPNSTAIAVSATGIVQACPHSSEFLLPMVPTLDAPQKDSVKRVERAIFTRNFASGFQQAYQLAQKFLTENRITQANKLLNICYQRQAVAEAAFPIQKEISSSKASAAAAAAQAAALQAASSSSTLLAAAGTERVKPEPIEMLTTITKDQFEKDLLFYSYYIPPNYPDHLWPAVDQKLMFSIEALKMSIDLEQFIRDEDATELVKILPDVADFMKRDPNSVDIAILFRLFSVLLPADFLSSLEIGHQLARVFTKNATAFYGIANMLMFPTLYDTNLNRDSVYGDVLQGNSGGQTSRGRKREDSIAGPSTPAQEKSGSTSSSAPVASTPAGAETPIASPPSSAPTSPGPLSPNSASSGVNGATVTSHKLYVGIQNAASALNTEITAGFLGDQLEFNWKFYKTLWGNNPKDALEMFDTNTVCLSATTWRLYLNLLTLHRQYDKLFIRGSKLGERVKGFPFADTLAQLLGDVVPRIQKYLRDISSLGMSMSGGSSSATRSRDAAEFNDSDESESVQSVNRLGRASNMVLNILHNSDARYLPKTLIATLPGSLHQLTVDLETSIREVVDEDSALDDADKLTRISTALKLISNGMNTTLGKKEPGGQFLDAINEYRNMVEANIRNFNAVVANGIPLAPSSTVKKGLGARGRMASTTNTDSPRVRAPSVAESSKKESSAALTGDAKK